MAAGLADLAAQSGRIDESPDLAVHLDQRVHRVDRGARDVVDHRPLIARQPVQQRALPHVRLTDQRHPPRTAPGRGQLRDLR